VYKELQTSRRDAASFENKVAFSYCTFFLIFTAFLIKGDFSLEGSIATVGVIFIAITMILAVLFVIQSGKATRAICKMIVRIEQIMGLHSDNAYISDEQVQEFEEIPFFDARVFPKEIMMWGSSNRWQSLIPHVFSVICSGGAAILAVFFA
jgi:hypothetical protein